MSNVVKFCGCKACRRGRRANHANTKKELRKFRRIVKRAIREGKEPPITLSVCYTD
jgi:hypothetical protein